jgi:hypothetical protein
LEVPESEFQVYDGSYRLIGFVISAYTRRHTVVHARYNTMTMLKTIKELLGIDSLGIFDANPSDMRGAFSPEARYTRSLPADDPRGPLPPASRGQKSAVSACRLSTH